MYDYLVSWLGKPQMGKGSGPLTESQAKQEVESRLKTGGNPNVTTGKITDKGEDYEVEIVTKEGGYFVDKILVDKNSGSMRSAYQK